MKQTKCDMTKCNDKTTNCDILRELRTIRLEKKMKKGILMSDNTSIGISKTGNKWDVILTVTTAEEGKITCAYGFGMSRYLTIAFKNAWKDLKSEELEGEW